MENWLEHLLGKEWEVFPAGGATGEAYFAQKEGQKLFLKRNSSPFLAVLSAEGIVPKLVWTKRMENGDVITAQHWLSGRELKAKDMDGENVARLLHKIHSSKELLEMLKRMGKQPLTPHSVLDDLNQALKYEPYIFPEISQAVQYLEKNVQEVDFEDKVVCHCDINHNNWMLSDHQQLYLIDWDGAMIADPAIDLGPLLYSYIKEEDWGSWLSAYGLELTENMLKRMYWYVLAQAITSILWNKAKDNVKELGTGLTSLQVLLSKIHQEN
ncbi:phosphotransferase family protein [Metabacillus lacus]